MARKPIDPALKRRMVAFKASPSTLEMVAEYAKKHNIPKSRVWDRAVINLIKGEQSEKDR